MLAKLFLSLRRRPACAAPANYGLYGEEQMRNVLDRERARSDRNGYVFTLLAFESRDANRDPSRWEALVQILRRRLRCTDEVGWLDEGRLGVVLLDTPPTGAWKVADDVLAAYPLDREPPHCEVYTYPHDGRPRDLPAQKVAAPDLDDDDERRARSLESFFMQPLPAWKRALDVAGGLAGCVLTLPLLLAAATAIRLESRGPVLFKQRRAGLGGEPFTIFKLRTMKVDAESCKQALRKHSEQDGPAFKLRYDPRVTAVGRFLRKTSIDELPQFWNVLRGDMSLVGPRPLPLDEQDLCLPWQQRRLSVTPGLTCIWQVRGRSRVTFDEWVRMDIAYIRRRTLRHDLSLILRTVWAVAVRKGAS